jgi:hypothetical protein
MTDAGPPNSPEDEPEVSNLTRAQGVLAIEAFALMVALVTPIFSTDPSYLEDVAASFLMVNGLLLFIGLAVWVTSRFGRSE